MDRYLPCWSVSYPTPVSYTHLVARGMGKCCVSGAGALEIDYKNKTVEVDGIKLKEGDYISINGTTGTDVYKRQPFASLTSSIIASNGSISSLLVGFIPNTCLLYTSCCTRYG